MRITIKAKGDVRTLIRNKIDRMYEAVRKINHTYEKWAADHGMTLYELQIYYELIKEKDRTGAAMIAQKELCARLDAPKTSISSMAKKQLATGYIETMINPNNKRENVISLTESGLEFARSLIEPLLRYEDEAASMIDDQDMETAIDVQNRFADIFLEKVVQKDE